MDLKKIAPDTWDSPLDTHPRIDSAQDGDLLMVLWAIKSVLTSGD